MVGVRWVFVEDVSGIYRGEYFVTTDRGHTPKQVGEPDPGRWADEVMLAEGREHLGLESTGGGCGGPFEAVVSVCPLTRLVDAVVRSVGERHPRFGELVRAVRRGHLRLLTRVTAAGGRGLAVSDCM